MSEQKLSKYAAKKAARAAANQSASIALNVIARIERGECVQPKTPPKPKAPPPEPRGLIADLGDAPLMCANRMMEAERLIREALEIARVMQNIAKRGRQAGEVLAVIGIIGSMTDKASVAARRAEGIPNVRGGEE